MLDHLTTAKNFLTTPVIKDALLWLLGVSLTFIVSRSPIGRRAWVWMKGRVSKLDTEAAAAEWNEFKRYLEVVQLTADSSVYALRDRGMPKPRLIPFESASDLQWMRNADVVTAADAARPPINKTHGFASGDAFKRGDRSDIDYISTTYAMVLAARATGHTPPIISANALVFCASTQRLLLMVRSDQVSTYPGALHFLGGNFEPRSGTESFDEADQESPLRRTALREIEEESGIKITPPKQGWVIVGEEHTTGFVQFTYAALYISEHEMNNRDSSLEGNVISVSFSELQDYVLSGRLPQAGNNQNDIKMTPSLALTLLAWLKIGAPDQHGRTPVKREAQALYKKIHLDIKDRL